MAHPCNNLCGCPSLPSIHTCGAGYPDIEPTKSPAEPMVRGLSAGASGIRTLGPTSEGANNSVERRRSWLRGRAARKAAIAPREMIDNYLRHLGIREQPAMPGLSHHQSR